MASNTMLGRGQTVAVNAGGSTRYLTAVGAASINATESFASLYRLGGTFSRLWMNVTGNAAGAGQYLHVAFMVAGSPGNQGFTVGPAQTGILQDTTNSDAVTSSQAFDIRTIQNTSP